MDYKGLNNQEYWNKRAEDKANRVWKDEAKVEKELQKAYLQAIDDFNKELSQLYSEYQVDGKLSYSETKKQLNAKELTFYRERIKELREIIADSNNEKALLELDQLSKYKRISRLNSKINQIQARLIQLGALEEKIITEHLSKSYEESFNRTLYEIQTGTGIGFSFNMLNSRAIEEAILYPWSGSMFSDLVWDNKDKLIVEMRKTITDGIIRGEGYRKMASNLHKVMSDKGYSDILRLIRTETAHVVEEASFKGYTESGIVSQYSIIATLDKKTGHICQKQDGKIYNLKDKKVGINFPPFHPNCRTTQAAYFEDQVIETRRARDENGKGILVDGSMTYEEWSKKYLKK